MERAFSKTSTKGMMESSFLEGRLIKDLRFTEFEEEED